MPPDAAAPAPARRRAFALLGDPVAHSLSPRLHNAALAAERLDGVYSAVRCSAAEVPGLMRSLARAGGGGNVTVPHKRVAAGAVDTATDAVRRTGACNTFWLEGGALAGDNTDVPGFERALRAFFGDPAGARVLLLGAGGAAAAALLALLGAGADRIVVVNRTPARARELVDHVGAGEAARAGVAARLDDLRDERFDLAVNATSLGLHGTDPMPVPLGGAPAYGAALDVVYAPGGTAWVRAALGAGIPAVDGHEMLLHQAAVAFERWWSRPAPLAAMRAALDDVGASGHPSAPASQPDS